MFYEDECKPKVIGAHQEPSDGEVMTEYIYNCENCECKSCKYWQEYN